MMAHINAFRALVSFSLGLCLGFPPLPLILMNFSLFFSFLFLLFFFGLDYVIVLALYTILGFFFFSHH